MKKISFLMIVLLIVMQSHSLDKRYFNRDCIFVDNIKTVQVFRSGDDLNPPVIDLYNPSEFIEIHFDDMDGDVKDYQYRILHYERDWTLSTDLFEMDYLDGINQIWVTNYDFSRSTTVPYTHYTINFPNENLKPKLSGNYILQLYLDDPEEPVMNCRFMVYEQQTEVQNWSIQQCTNPEYYNQKQTVKFSLNVQKCQIQDPYRYFSVVMLQNWRWDNAHVFSPFMINGNIYQYTNDGPNNDFNGLNTFRVVQFSSFRNSYDNTLVVYQQPFYHVMLRGDIIRAGMQYIYTPDIYGKYRISNVDGQYSPFEADYAIVDFYLISPKPIAGGDFYVQGAFTHWNYLPEYKMVYDNDRRGYVASILMKQGYYNYYYSFLRTGMIDGDDTVAEGNHSESRNEYTILVYNREEGGRYDKLVGVHSTISN